MFFKMRGEMAALVALGARWVAPEAAGAAAGWLLWTRLRRGAERFRRQNHRTDELRAYAELDVCLAPQQEVCEVAERVCRTMSERSAFRRTAMLVCPGQGGAEGRLRVSATAGMDEAAVQWLEAWADGLGSQGESQGDVPGQAIRRGDPLGVSVSGASFAVVLGKRPAEIGYARGIVIPLWATGGRMLGALAVCADGLMAVRRSALREALAPIESLAFKVARSLENAAQAERLMRAEKLAGLGLLAGGMAHALNNPLTAVLGFAELIQGTAEDPRVKGDAAIIAREALKMRQTVESLLEFWQPVGAGDQPVNVLELVRELAAGCADQLKGRGVRLVVQTASEELLVQGNRHRLRQLLEHLLNNAAQALAAPDSEKGSGKDRGTPVAKAGDEQAIRLCVSSSAGSGVAKAVHLTVSDTGPGFREPDRIFEPSGLLDTTGTGLGLSLCYSIVQEHGGEIRAFNVRPHGAAVTVQLPALRVAAKQEPAGASSASCVTS